MRIVIAFIFLVVTTTITAQLRIDGQIYYGTYVEDISFAIPCSLGSNAPNFSSLQYKVVYFDANGVKRSITPTDADEIRFRYYGLEKRMVSVVSSLPFPITNKGPKIFLHLEIDGAVKLYRYYITQKNQTSNNFNSPFGFNTPTFSIGTSRKYERFILQKENSDKLVIVYPESFKVDMIKFYEDCEDLKLKIEKREFKYKDVLKTVIFYNNNCMVE